SFVLAPWASRRRQDLLDLLDQLTPKIQQLTQALEAEVEKRAVTRRLMTHPGVGPLTALAFELVIGTPERFHCGKQIASYVGLVPSEESSGDRRRCGRSARMRGGRRHQYKPPRSPRQVTKIADHPRQCSSSRAGRWSWRSA